MTGKEYYPDMKKSEKDVAKYLNKLGIDWYYEYPVFIYDDKDRPRVWTPDFYLPQLKVHLEVCGSDKFDYKYREKLYQDNDVSTIFIHHYKERSEWQKWLRTQLWELEEKRHKKIVDIVKKLL